MDGLVAKSTDPCEKDNYGLKLHFLLMCIPLVRDKELKYLDNFLIGPDFSLDNISSMSIGQMASKIQKLEMQKMHITSSRLLRESSMLGMVNSNQSRYVKKMCWYWHEDSIVSCSICVWYCQGKL